ncbi:alpha/beta hydrolase [Shewanella algidipiscicola]|uniref:Esterase n=1 Tax=Shewanella algidipiscicola TaxID=614070 RepID=A0ABQ4PKD4_9GAMM|nr:alpha/beta fold hydrolase [Shewanella algidipiscicola]GIU48057.1 esterase [Shewanella algidipiscicola]
MKILLTSTKHLLLALTYGALGTVIALLGVGIYLLNAQPELSIWHTTSLSAQFRQSTPLTNFEQYLALEEMLFTEVDNKIYKRTQDMVNQPLNRYVRHSLSDPNQWSQDWNRSYEWSNPTAQFGVLLLHGMSDSPYSLSHFANHFRPKAHVLGLRLPGHGTLPSGLVDLRWQDMAQAVTLATRHLQQQLNGKPLYVVGFSTGAALALNHELEALSQDNPSSYAGLIFLSPAIGLTPVAAAAKWQSRLGQWLGLEKLSWNAVQTEYDPFKYNSFAVNAGDVVYQVAARNQVLLHQMTESQKRQLARVITFQSVADSTVSTVDVIAKLYLGLPAKEHQLFLFDINRLDVNLALIVNDPIDAIKLLIDPSPLPYQLNLVQNQHYQDSFGQWQTSEQVEVARYQQGLVEHEPLNISWPTAVYSLSHVALPFPASDSLYGAKKRVSAQLRVQIGAVSTKGERGVLGVPASEVLRQKWNPFFAYMLERIDDYINTEQQRLVEDPSMLKAEHRLKH